MAQCFSSSLAIFHIVQRCFAPLVHIHSRFNLGSLNVSGVCAAPNIVQINLILKQNLLGFLVKSVLMLVQTLALARIFLSSTV